ncbi:MAG TPA: translocation/assembly module TamB domain-containing protein, partial [Polyangia bacterium]
QEQNQAAAGTETRVVVGKNNSDRIYVGYVHVFGAAEDQNQNEAHVRYQINPNWVLETLFGDAGVGALDVLWTKRY